VRLLRGKFALAAEGLVAFASDPAPLQRSPDEWADGLLAELDEAAQARLMSDVPLGAMLSGSLDSSLRGLDRSTMRRRGRSCRRRPSTSARSGSSAAPPTRGCARGRAPAGRRVRTQVLLSILMLEVWLAAFVPRALAPCASDGGPPARRITYPVI
jgi:hypothetical protein